MLQLLQPIWLLAGAGIVVPVMIHLWNVKQGKVLKIGSVAFLQQSSKQQSRSLKISEWLLLLLRCLLILLLALLLAQPQWKQTIQPKDAKGWLVIERDNTNKIYGGYKPLIDSLLANEYELHSFEEGFPLFELKDSSSVKDTLTKYNDPYWQQAQQLSKTAVTIKPVYLFTGNHLNKFMAEKPALSGNIKWLSLIDTTTDTWIEAAYKTSNDSIRIITGSSTNKGTAYLTSDLAFTEGEAKDYSIDKSKSTIRLLSQTPVNIDTSTLTVVVYSDKYIADANYATAALKAIQQFTKRRIEVVVTNNTNKIPAKTNWLFWLSDEAPKLSNTSTKIIRYTAGKSDETFSWMGDENIGLYKIISSQTNGPILWKDGFSNPVLSSDSSNKNIYNLHTHFDPSWNDMVWNENFPGLLLKLILANNTTTAVKAEKDKRQIDVQQLSPAKNNNSTENITSTVVLKDITNIVWLIAFLVFVIERVLSFKTKKTKPTVG